MRYLIEFTKSPLFLNKALFYADFKHFQQYGTSITGARYVHLEYGPCPDQYQSIYQLLLTKGVLILGKDHLLKSREKPNMDIFSDTEKEVLAFIAKKAQADGGKKLLKISHDEEAFKQTGPMELISYAFSKDLKI